MGDESANEVRDERSQFDTHPLDPSARPDRPGRNAGETSSQETRQGFGRRRRDHAVTVSRAFAHLRGSATQAAASEWERGTAFLFVPVCLSAGALTYFHISWEPPFAPLLSSAAALSAAYFLARSRFLLRPCSSAPCSWSRVCLPPSLKHGGLRRKCSVPTSPPGSSAGS
jgi:hypothetical protein